MCTCIHAQACKVARSTDSGPKQLRTPAATRSRVPARRLAIHPRSSSSSSSSLLSSPSLPRCSSRSPRACPPCGSYGSPIYVLILIPNISQMFSPILSLHSQWSLQMPSIGTSCGGISGSWEPSRSSISGPPEPSCVGIPGPSEPSCSGIPSSPAPSRGGVPGSPEPSCDGIPGSPEQSHGGVQSSGGPSRGDSPLQLPLLLPPTVSPHNLLTTATATIGAPHSIAIATPSTTTTTYAACLLMVCTASKPLVPHSSQ